MQVQYCTQGQLVEEREYLVSLAHAAQRVMNFSCTKCFLVLKLTSFRLTILLILEAAIPVDKDRVIRAMYVALSLGPSQILSRSHGEKSWDQNYTTDRKWWTRLVQTKSTLHTNRVHHFRPMT